MHLTVAQAVGWGLLIYGLSFVANMMLLLVIIGNRKPTPRICPANNRLRITGRWLRQHGACSEGRHWFNAQSETIGVKLVRKLMAERNYGWARWLLCRMLTRTQCLEFSLLIARQYWATSGTFPVIQHFLKLAIIRLEQVLNDDSRANRHAVESLLDAVCDEDRAPGAILCFARIANSTKDNAAYLHGALLSCGQGDVKTLEDGLEIIERDN